MNKANKIAIYALGICFVVMVTLLVAYCATSEKAFAEAAEQGTEQGNTETNCSCCQTNCSCCRSNSSSKSPLVDNNLGSYTWDDPKEFLGKYSYAARLDGGVHIGKYGIVYSMLDGDYSAEHQEEVIEEHVQLYYGSWEAAAEWYNQHGWY